MYEKEQANRQADRQNLGESEDIREKLFYEIFEIPYSWAFEMATWEGEIGDRWRGVFEYIKHYKEEYDTNRQSSESGGEAQ